MLLDQWCVTLHFTAVTRENKKMQKLSLGNDGGKSDHEGFSPLLSPSQGPRGLPGERGRSGPSGAAVSLIICLRPNF